MFKIKVSIAVSKFYFGWIANRSSMAKGKLRVEARIADANYRRKPGVIINNYRKKKQQLKKGERIAQFIVIPCIFPNVKIKDTLDKTKLEAKGFDPTER